jgi:two-component system alkaline phosphatase synthesis response regulator PhoP
MPGVKILVVDDEPNILNIVKPYLAKEGYTVYTASNGPDGLQATRKLQPDLVILDIMLPGMDGIEMLSQLRRESDVYVLMLTARSEEADKVVGLSVGADDYLTKPFSPRELVARVKAILRRGRGTGQPVEEPVLAFSRIRLDPARREVWKDDQPVELTALEFDLLKALASYRGMVLSREQLLQQVWGYDFYGDDRVVDVHVGNIRKKLEDDPANPTLITTVRGVGYRFEDELL